MKKTPSSTRIGKRYRFNKVGKDYDSIIIGSGTGGLTSAALLAKMGISVRIGTALRCRRLFNTYERNGYEWDLGVHYICDVGHTKTTARRPFD